MFSPGDSEMVWCSFAQLFVHWRLTEGHEGVIKKGKG